MALHLRSRLAVARARAEAALGSMPTPLRRSLRGVRQFRRRLAAAVRAVRGPLDRRRARRLSHLTYRDDVVRLDADGIVIRRYYWPLGRKRVDFDAIQAWHTFPLTGMARYRVHGWGYPRRWYHRDPERSSKEVGLELDTGAWLRPVITPVEPVTVLDLLREAGHEADTGGTGRAGRA